MNDEQGHPDAAAGESTRRAFLKTAAGGGAAAALAGLGVWGGVHLARRRRPKNVLIYLSDTLRANSVGCYGYGPNTSPHVDRFAESAVLFEKAYSVAPWTKPMVGTLLAGVSPAEHQAGAMTGTGYQLLRPGLRTLAEILSEQGYQTAYFSSNPVVNEGSQFLRGFDRVGMYAYAPYMVDMFFDWIGMTDGERPFFAVVHEIDPHAIYAPSDEDFAALHGISGEEALASLAPADRELVVATREYFDAEGEPRDFLFELSRDGAAYLRMLYDAEVVRVDREFGRLTNWVERNQLGDETLVIFTSDHGEGFGEHPYRDARRKQYGSDGFFHGQSLYDELLHVPLVIGGCGAPSGGAQVPHTVSLADLFETILEFSTCAAPDYARGAPLLNGRGELRVDSDRDAVACFYSMNGPTEPSTWDYALVHGNEKVIRNTQGNYDGGEWLYYDLARDPGETRDPNKSSEAAEGHPLRARLERICEERLARSAELDEQFGPPIWIEEGEQDALDALGYF